MHIDPLPSPAAQPVPTASDVTAGPYTPPKQRIFFYESAEWEQFILEWVHQLNEEYEQVKLIAGSGDRGIDIAGFRTQVGFEGPWDCYQCKHYTNALTPTSAFPEILKVLKHVVQGDYLLPERYRFLTPKGCGPSLELLFNSPAALKKSFLEDLQDKGKRLGKDLDPALLSRIRDYAESSVDFFIFNSEPIDDVIEVHRKSPYHLKRFGGGLPTRPNPLTPPANPVAEEQRYIEQLMEVYDERYGGTRFNPNLAMTDPRTSEHFPRQRETFYWAESLRVFARDKVPDGTFEALADDVFDGVIEEQERDHPDGMCRLSEILLASTRVQLTSNALIHVTRPSDRRGICHYLANSNRLTWVRRTE